LLKIKILSIRVDLANIQKITCSKFKGSKVIILEITFGQSGTGILSKLPIFPQTNCQLYEHRRFYVRTREISSRVWHLGA
jgi:hypothetical protein